MLNWDRCHGESSVIYVTAFTERVYLRMLRLEALNHPLSVMADPSTPPAIVFSEHPHLSTPQSLGTAVHAEYHTNHKYVNLPT